jgi:hypothetical protein
MHIKLLPETSIEYISLGRSENRWGDNIKINITEMGYYGADCIKLAQDRGQWWAIVNKVMNLRVIHLLISLTTSRFLDITLFHGYVYEEAKFIRRDIPILHYLIFSGSKCN